MPIPAPVATNLYPRTAATQTLQKPAARLTREASTAHPTPPHPTPRGRRMRGGGLVVSKRILSQRGRPKNRRERGLVLLSRPPPAEFIRAPASFLRQPRSRTATPTPGAKRLRSAGSS